MIGFYVNNKLQYVDVYKSDGIVSFTIKELKSDKNLSRYLNMPLDRILKIRQNSLYDNHVEFSYEKKGDSIFVNRSDGIIIYVSSQ